MRDLAATRPYARALFAEAVAKDQVLACQQGLEEAVRLIALKGSIRDVLAHPTVSLDDKRKMIHSALGEYATPLLERFLSLLVENHRFDLLEAIRGAFQDEVDRSQSIQSVMVQSAFPMNEKSQAALQNRLEAWLKTKVRIKIQVDPELIGGLIIETKDVMVDQSLRGQLQKLQQQISA